jgi:hypothetical protein
MLGVFCVLYVSYTFDYRKNASLLVEVRGNLSIHLLALFDEFIQDSHDRVDTLVANGAVHLSEELVDLCILSFLFSIILA